MNYYPRTHRTYCRVPLDLAPQAPQKAFRLNRWQALLLGISAGVVFLAFTLGPVL